MFAAQLAGPRNRAKSQDTAEAGAVNEKSGGFYECSRNFRGENVGWKGDWPFP
jgi:hypothetical protein